MTDFQKAVNKIAWQWVWVTLGEVFVAFLVSLIPVIPKLFFPSMCISVVIINWMFFKSVINKIKDNYKTEWVTDQSGNLLGYQYTSLKDGDEFWQQIEKAWKLNEPKVTDEDKYKKTIKDLQEPL